MNERKKRNAHARKTEIKKEQEYIDESTKKYIYIQSTATLFNYLKELGPDFLPKHGPLREFCQEVFVLCGQYLMKECPSATKRDKLPEKQRKTYETPLKAITKEEAEKIIKENKEDWKSCVG